MSLVNVEIQLYLPHHWKIWQKHLQCHASFKGKPKILFFPFYHLSNPTSFIVMCLHDVGVQDSPLYPIRCRSGNGHLPTTPPCIYSATQISLSILLNVYVYMSSRQYILWFSYSPRFLSSLRSSGNVMEKEIHSLFLIFFKIPGGLHIL